MNIEEVSTIISDLRRHSEELAVIRARLDAARLVNAAESIGRASRDLQGAAANLEGLSEPSLINHGPDGRPVITTFSKSGRW